MAVHPRCATNKPIYFIVAPRIRHRRRSYYESWPGSPPRDRPIDWCAQEIKVTRIDGENVIVLGDAVAQPNTAECSGSSFLAVPEMQTRSATRRENHNYTVRFRRTKVLGRILWKFINQTAESSSGTNFIIWTP